jgi:hypothetical protein
MAQAKATGNRRRRTTPLRRSGEERMTERYDAIIVWEGTADELAKGGCDNP